MKRIDMETFVGMAAALRQPYHAGYYAMYSSVLDGITTEPALMTLPLDDHMAHRGDAVFEAMKFIQGGIYNLDAHLQRLHGSAKAIGLALPMDIAAMKSVVVETVRAGGKREGLVRLFVSRGPGGFSADPYAVAGSQLYGVVTALPPSFMDRHPEGARLGVSEFLPKHPFYARVKSCNYLPNVLMKKEAVDRGLDAVVAFDEQGFMREGSTENVGVVTSDGYLVFPDPDRMLQGTTMMRVMALAQTLVANRLLAGTAFRDMRRDEVDAAREILVVGTTWDVSAACWFEGQTVGDGTPGPVQTVLRALLIDDSLGNDALRTPVGG